MKKLMILSSLLVFGLSGCEEEATTGIDYSLDQVLFACNSNNSADFAWLDEFVANAEAQPSGYYVVDLMEYNSSVYILLQDNLSASPPAIYNCNGELALTDLGLTYNEFVDQSTKLKTVYSK